MVCAVSHVQQGVSSVRSAKRTLKEFEEVSELGFKHLTEGEDVVVSQDGHSLLR